MTPPHPTRCRHRRLVLGAVALAVVAVILVVELRPPAAPADHHVTERRVLPVVPPETSSSSTPSSRRNAIATEPMLSVQPAEGRPTTTVPQTAEVIAVPPASVVGPAGVPSGFPRTPEGAVGQLAALVKTVLEQMSQPRTAAIHGAWALPGAVSADQWALTGHVGAFLAAGGASTELGAAGELTVVPAAGLVKGSDGPDWVLVCVLLEVRAILMVEARMGYGHCERLQWHRDPRLSATYGTAGGGRWMVAPGGPPALAPSTWPGSEASRRAGWRPWSELLKSDLPAEDR